MKNRGTELDITSRHFLVAYGWAMTLAVAGTWAWAYRVLDPGYVPGLAAGWAVALGLALIGLAIKRIALRGGTTWFLAWALGMNGLRALILLMILVAVANANMAHSRPFLVAALAGYLCCLAGEIGLIHTASKTLWDNE